MSGPPGTRPLSTHPDGAGDMSQTIKQEKLLDIRLLRNVLQDKLSVIDNNEQIVLINEEDRLCI